LQTQKGSKHFTFAFVLSHILHKLGIYVNFVSVRKNGIYLSLGHFLKNRKSNFGNKGSSSRFKHERNVNSIRFGNNGISLILLRAIKRHSNVFENGILLLPSHSKVIRFGNVGMIRFSQFSVKNLLIFEEGVIVVNFSQNLQSMICKFSDLPIVSRFLQQKT